MRHAWSVTLVRSTRGSIDDVTASARTARRGAAIVGRGSIARFRSDAHEVTTTSFAPDVALAAGVGAVCSSAGLSAGTGAMVVAGGLVTDPRFDTDMIAGECLSPDVALTARVRTVRTVGVGCHRSGGNREKKHKRNPARGPHQQSSSINLGAGPGHERVRSSSAV